MSAVTEELQSVALQEKQEKPMRKRRRVHGVKVCQVCGDKALAHHFGALACETCKAFFRRNALCKEQKKCLFKGECQIDVKTRRFCPACRLTKCFSVGMQTDLILDEEEKKQRLLKMTQKKSQRETCKLSPEAGGESAGSSRHSPVCAVTTTGDDVSFSSDPTSFSPDQTPDMMEQAWLAASSEMAAVDPQAVRDLGSSSMSSQWSPGELTVGAGQNVEAVLSSSQELKMDHQPQVTYVCSRESVAMQSFPELSYPPVPATPSCGMEYNSTTGYSSAPRSEVMTPQPPTQDTTGRPSTPVLAPSFFTTPFKHVSREELPSDPFMYWRLSEEERSLLTQLSSAYQDTVLSVLQGCPPREDINNQLLNHEMYLQECEHEAGNAVSFAKRMEDFRQLRLDEQIALLKASTCQVLGIRSCALYIAEKDAWLTRGGYFTLAQGMKLMPNHPHLGQGVNFCRTVKSIIKNDVTLYALLHCVVLFDPSDERVIDRQLINSIRDKYIILLRHYLESVYSYVHSEKYMMALQENLISYRSLCQEGKPLIKKYFPSIPNKLLLEVLDLD